MPEFKPGDVVRVPDRSVMTEDGRLKTHWDTDTVIAKVNKGHDLWVVYVWRTQKEFVTHAWQMVRTYV